MCTFCTQLTQLHDRHTPIWNSRYKMLNSCIATGPMFGAHTVPHSGIPTTQPPTQSPYGPSSKCAICALPLDLCLVLTLYPIQVFQQLSLQLKVHMDLQVNATLCIATLLCLVLIWSPLDTPQVVHLQLLVCVGGHACTTFIWFLTGETTMIPTSVTPGTSGNNVHACIGI